MKSQAPKESVMDIKQERKYLCAVCRGNEIKECRTEHTFEGEPPDQSNCDLSTYSGYEVRGGRLFASRPKGHYMSLTQMPAKIIGGICNACLESDIAKRFLPHLNLEPVSE